MEKPEIILASKSPRRTAILKQLKIPHKVVVSNAREYHHYTDCPSEIVLENSKTKAESVAKDYYESIVIGADTIVVLNNKVYGKPSNIKQAEQFFQEFMGHRIEILTGVTLIFKEKIVSGFEKTYINVKTFSNEQVKMFMKDVDPLHRAGGFSMEGTEVLMFDDIEGSYLNVLGLPVYLFWELFERITHA